MGKRVPETRPAARAPRPARPDAPNGSSRSERAADVITEPLAILDESEQTHVNRPRRASVFQGVDGSGGDPPAGQPRRRGPGSAVATPGRTAVTMGADDLPDGLVVADADGRVVALNRAAERVLGCTAEDVVGQDVRSALPLQDTAGRSWWACTDPWNGLATRTGHRERL